MKGIIPIMELGYPQTKTRLLQMEESMERLGFRDDNEYTYYAYRISTGETTLVSPNIGSYAEFGVGGNRVIYDNRIVTGPQINVYDLATGLTNTLANIWGNRVSVYVGFDDQNLAHIRNGNLYVKNYASDISTLVADPAARDLLFLCNGELDAYSLIYARQIVTAEIVDEEPVTAGTTLLYLHFLDTRTKVQVTSGLSDNVAIAKLSGDWVVYDPVAAPWPSRRPRCNWRSRSCR